jgi:hypothetical protein
MTPVIHGSNVRWMKIGRVSNMYDMIPVIHGYVRLMNKVWFHPYDVTPIIHGSKVRWTKIGRVSSV